jgi:hypothetical protein
MSGVLVSWNIPRVWDEFVKVRRYFYRIYINVTERTEIKPERSPKEQNNNGLACVVTSPLLH